MAENLVFHDASSQMFEKLNIFHVCYNIFFFAILFAWLLDNGNLFFIVMETGSPRSGCQPGQLHEDPLPGPRLLISLQASHGRAQWWLCTLSSISIMYRIHFRMIGLINIVLYPKFSKNEQVLFKSQFLFVIMKIISLCL